MEENTKFTKVYDRFLGKITDDMYMELDECQTEEMLDELLLNALPWFEFPRVNLNSYDLDNKYFDARLTDDEINIIGKYVADNESFVVFNTSYPENFKFYYELNGENLSLTYGDGTIVLKRQK